MENITGGDHAGYPRDIDLEDAQLVAKILQKHREKQLPGASVFDEILATLLKENQELRDTLKSRTVTPERTTPSLGWAEQVLSSQIEMQQRHLGDIGGKAETAIEENRGLQSEAERLKEEFLRLYHTQYPKATSCVLDDELTPPTYEFRNIQLSAEQSEDRLEVLTVDYYQVTKKVDYAKATLEYYKELPEKVEDLREAVQIAREGRWDELFSEPQVDVTKEVVSDLVVENARLKKEAAEARSESRDLQSSLNEARDTIAEQKFTMGEMQAQIDLLKRQLASEKRVNLDLMLSSLQ